MITIDEGLRRTQEAVRHLELGLADLHRERERMHPSWYDAQADPVIEHILRLRAEIDAYLGIPADRKPERENAALGLREDSSKTAPIHEAAASSPDAGSRSAG